MPNSKALVTRSYNITGWDARDLRKQAHVWAGIGEAVYTYILSLHLLEKKSWLTKSIQNTYNVGLYIMLFIA